MREAVCLANNLAPDTATINLPAGTYDLTSLETGELQQGTGNSYSLSIVGASTSNTLIQQTDGHDRILEEDLFVQGNNPVAISNVTMQLGTCTTGTDCTFGGGAILAGGGVGDNITLTNVVVSNNSVSAGGGGDDGGGVNDAGGTLTITNSTISSNTTDSTGGGLFFTDQGAPNGEGSVTITNSTFSSNTDATAGGGGAYINLDSGFTLTVSGSTFTENKVTGGSAPGGGIFAEQGGSSTTTVTVSNSRFVGNSNPVGGTGIAVDEATANLQNNWWGCNAGPGNTGCDSVAINAGGGFNPWLVLNISANPTQINANGTSQLTADLTHNSSGTGGFSVPNGTPVTFGGTLDSSVNPTSTTLTSGQANSTYTAGSTPGAGSGTASVDNQDVSVTINIKANTSTTVAVYDAGTDSPWSNTEVAGASSYANSTVLPAGTGGPAPTREV